MGDFSFYKLEKGGAEMSQVINEIQLDFSHSQNITIPAMQLDKGTRFIRVRLQNNKRSVDVTGTQIVIMAIRHDRQEVIESCRILDASKGLIEFEISEAMTATQGEVLCQLKVFDNADLLNSQVFKISVGRSLLLTTGGSDCQCPSLDWIISDIEDIRNHCNENYNKLEQKHDGDLNEVRTELTQINTRLSLNVRYFNTVNDMKINSNSLRLGDYVETLGYYEVGDDGGCKYVIENTKHEWSIQLGDQLYANINEPIRVNYRQFGAYLNGVDDDYNAMLMCHAYADSIKYFDSEDRNVYYTCTVENHNGIIYKQGTESINFCSNIDLSGSTLLVDDTNATWFGIYVWGDGNSLHWDYEIPDEIKQTFTADNYVIELPSNDELPANTVLRIEETPYAVRDDDGYLYSVGRKELLIHDMNGICSSPFADDWSHAGGEEINCKITDKVTDEEVNYKSFSVLKASYNFIPNRHGVFTGCEVKLNMSPNRYSSVLTVKRHNAIVKDFVFKPNPEKLHNTMYKNSMIYLQDSYNVTVRNIQGFNSAGMMQNNEKATSGYMLRLTNCSDVNVEDCRMQGYWGATAMDSVKNIYFNRCHMNRLDVHDYFYNLYASNCTFYHHSIQLGYGRGVASFKDCNFYYNNVPNDSYPSAYAVAFNLTYGRIFEGTLSLDNCNIYVKDTPDNEYNLVQMFFRPDATSIIKHFKFPEIRCRNIHITSCDPNTKFSYVRVGGSRYARTGNEMPSHVYGEMVDNDLRWRYIGRTFDWGKETGRSLDVIENDLLRVADTTLNEDQKTIFYNYRYYKCTKAGTMVFNNKPSNDATSITVGTARFERIDDPSWRSRHQYNVGDIAVVSSSNFYEPYIYQCIQSGISNGYFPIHTSGTVLEGPNDVINEPDLCWWTYIGPKSEWCRDFRVNTRYTVGERFIADGKIYEVIEDVLTTEYPPFITTWLKDFEYGGGVLKYLGNKWQPKKWFAKDSFCEADGRIYQLAKHHGITTGILPTKGNLFCVDGDLTWEYKGDAQNESVNGNYVEWKPNTNYETNTLIRVDNRIYEVQELKTGSSYPNASTVSEVYMDGSLPVKYYGEHLLSWRVAGNSYEVGDIISDNTFLVICIQAGTTNINSKWGPLESATGWLEDDTYNDGTCVWKKLTKTASDGVWRNSNTYYPVGKFLLISSNNYFKVYEVQEARTSATKPTNTTLNEKFLDGTLTLMYKGLSNAWLADARYNLGDIIEVNSHRYECVFDGRLVLPNKSIFENITTNLTKGSVFKFSSDVSVPTRQGDTRWEVIVRDCEGIVNEVEGLPQGKSYFGDTNNINPIVKMQ